MVTFLNCTHGIVAFSSLIPSPATTRNSIIRLENDIALWLSLRVEIFPTQRISDQCESIQIDTPQEISVFAVHGHRVYLFLSCEIEFDSKRGVHKYMHLLSHGVLDTINKLLASILYYTDSKGWPNCWVQNLVDHCDWCPHSTMSHTHGLFNLLSKESPYSAIVVYRSFDETISWRIEYI